MNKKKLTKLFVLFALLSVTLLVLACTSTGNVVEKPDVLTIGVMTALTGDLAVYGEGTVHAAQLAVREINQAGGINGMHVELAIEDSPCDATVATTVIDKLLYVDDTDVLLGPLCSSELLAIAPKLNQEHMVTISSSTTSPDISSAGDYIFRNVASDDLRSKVFAEYIYTEKGIKELAIVYENDDAGVGFDTAFVQKYEELGGTLLINEQYDKDSADMRTQLLKVQHKNPEALLLISYPSETGTLLKQSQELGLDAQFFEGFEVMTDPQVEEIAGDAINGVEYIQSVSPETEKNKQFKKTYKAVYGTDAPYYSVEAYDIVYLYKKALQNGVNSEQIKEHLYALKNFEGASGTISFDENGDCVKPFEIGRVQHNELTTVKII